MKTGSIILFTGGFRLWIIPNCNNLLIQAEKVFSERWNLRLSRIIIHWTKNFSHLSCLRYLFRTSVALFLRISQKARSDRDVNWMTFLCATGRWSLGECCMLKIQSVYSVSLSHGNSSESDSFCWVRKNLNRILWLNNA